MKNIEEGESFFGFIPHEKIRESLLKKGGNLLTKLFSGPSRKQGKLFSKDSISRKGS